ncbi:alpha/beta fold hydrolase [Miltoncostaea marina]|uniref:alpha/beta fold hydrolase n=1 Tax=Miltoncostaea marina TaxID=2843215 RepID=UPI001C3E2385|nr:alpha/beta hydrolase [Miltoncostaea marina]
MGEVAITERGEGPPVLLLHGLNGFKEGWGPLPGAIAAAGMRAVTADLPGSGASPRPARGRAAPAALARAVEALADRLGPLALVAHSLGAQVAMLAARARPALVRRLVLLAPWVEPHRRRMPPRGVADLLALPLVGRPLARLAIRAMRRDPARRRAAFAGALGDPAALARDPAAAALLEEAAARLARADVRAMADWAASGIRLDVRPLAAGIAAPALVVAGDRDRVTRADGAARLAAAFPRGRLLRVPGAGHFPHIERPGEVLPAVVEHLR